MLKLAAPFLLAMDVAGCLPTITPTACSPSVPLYALELTLEEIPFGDYLKGEQSHTRESERCGQSTRQDSSDHARVPASSRSGAIREAVVSENPFTGTTVWQLESQQ